LSIVRVDVPEILGFALARRMSNHTHVMEFTPIDKSFVSVCSWNAPENLTWPPKDWILLTRMKLKKIPARSLWKDMRSRGYWVWIGGKNNKFSRNLGECTSISAIHRNLGVD